MVELSVIAETKTEAGKMARGILDNAREFIDTDEGIFLNDEEDEGAAELRALAEHISVVTKKLSIEMDG